MLKADLHIHSTVSDGSDSINEIIEMAVHKGLDAIAVTDHDTLAHMAQIPGNAPVKVLGGVEISAMDNARGIRAHILGYHIENPCVVEEFVHPLLASRHANSIRQMEILEKHGFLFDTDKMLKADGKYIYKQHIMEYLVRTNQAAELFGEFYRSVFKNGGVCAFDIAYLDVFEAVRTIRQAGGQAVLAHPGQQQNYYLIPELVQCGLGGIEYNHPANSDEDKKIIQKFAQEYGLYLTGGSDFHGRFDDQTVKIGDYIAEESGADALVK